MRFYVAACSWFLLSLPALVCAGEVASVPACETDFFSAPLDRLDHRTPNEKSAEEAIADLPAWGSMSSKTHERLVNLWNWHDPLKCSKGIDQWLQEIGKRRRADVREIATILMARQRWCGEWSWEDSLAGHMQFYRLCASDAPVDTQEQLDFLALMASYTPMKARELQAMHEVFSGKAPTVFSRRDQALYNRMRLWSDPARYAQDMISTQRQADCRAMRMYLRDFSSLQALFCEPGLRVVGCPRGIDMPAQGAEAFGLLARRHAAALPGKMEIAALLQRRQDLPAVCLGMPVRAALAADPGSAPWKPAIVEGSASPLEMPDCSAVALPQWNASYLGFAGAEETPDRYRQWLEDDLDELESLLASLQKDGLTARCMKEVFSLCIQEMNEGRARWWIETINEDATAPGNPGHVFAGEPASSGAASGAGRGVAGFISDPASVARSLLVRLHRVCLELAWLGEHVRLAEAFDAQAQKLASLCNAYGLWPLVALECEAFHLDPLVKKSLFAGFRGDVKYLAALVNNIWACRYAGMFHKPVSPDKLIEGMVDDHVLNDELPSSRERKEQVAERWMRVATGAKHVLPLSHLCEMGMEEVANRRRNVTVKEVTMHASYTGYALVLQSLREGRLDRARAIYARMDSLRYAMPLAMTCLAKAALQRAEGNEAGARRSVCDALMIGVSRILDGYGAPRSMYSAFLSSGLLDELEKISCFQSGKMPLHLLEKMAGAWAAQGQFSSACYDLELLIHNGIFKLAVQKSQSHRNIVRWRLKADMCRGLALLQRGRREEGMRLVRSALEGMLDNPTAAADAVPWVLQCPLIPREERLLIKKRQLEALQRRMAEPHPRGKNYNELAWKAISQASIDPSPPIDRPEDPRDFDQMLRDAAPFRSEWVEWHILPDGADAGETLVARIASAEYERGGDKAAVLLRTRADRYVRVPFTRLEPQDIRHVIAWKKSNGLRTWNPAPENPAEYSTPQDGRLERVRHENGGTVLTIAGSTGFLYEVPLERVSDEDKIYVRQWEDERYPH